MLWTHSRHVTVHLLQTFLYAASPCNLPPLIAGLFELRRNNSRNLDCNQDLTEWEQRSQGNCTFFRLDGEKSALILPSTNNSGSFLFSLFGAE